VHLQCQTDQGFRDRRGACVIDLSRFDAANKNSGSSSTMDLQPVSSRREAAKKQRIRACVGVSGRPPLRCTGCARQCASARSAAFPGIRGRRWHQVVLQASSKRNRPSNSCSRWRSLSNCDRFAVRWGPRGGEGSFAIGDGGDANASSNLWALEAFADRRTAWRAVLHRGPHGRDSARRRSPGGEPDLDRSPCSWLAVSRSRRADCRWAGVQRSNTGIWGGW